MNPKTENRAKPKKENKNIFNLPIRLFFLNGVSIYFQLRYAKPKEQAINTDRRKLDGSLKLLNLENASNG